MTRINYDEVETIQGSEGAVLIEGKSIVDAYFNEWSKEEGPAGTYFKMTFVVDDADVPGAPSLINNRSIANAKSQGFLKGDLLTMGQNPNPLVDVEDQLDDSRGARVRLRLRTEDYSDKQGNPRQSSKIAAVLPVA